MLIFSGRQVIRRVMLSIAVSTCAICFFIVFIFISSFSASAATPVSLVWATNILPNLQATSADAACKESWQEWERLQNWAVVYGYGNSGWNAPDYSGDQTSGSCISYYWYPQSMPPGPPVTGDTNGFYSAYANVVCPSGVEVRGGYCYTPGDLFPPKNNDVPDTCAGTNPCNAVTGNKFQYETDYVGAGMYPLRWARAYNSNLVGTANFGSGWRSFYDRSVVANSNGEMSKATVMRGGGKAYYFNMANGVWIGDVDVVGKLIRLTNGSGAMTGWSYANEQDEVETYDAGGKFVLITNRQNQSHTLTYSCKTISVSCNVITPPTIARIANLLIAVTDPVGRKLNFAYDGSSRLQSMTDPTGSIYTYAYSGPAPGGHLTSVKYPDGKIRIYLYGETANVSSAPNTGINYAHSLTGIIDENNNRYASWTYDAAGRATSSEHGTFGSGIDRIGLAYGTADASGISTTSVTDSKGVLRSYSFSTMQGVVKNTGISGQPCNGCSAAITYDPNGNVASRTDFNGNKTNYGYDLSRNLETSHVEAFGTALAITITTQWHPTYRLPAKIAEPKRITTFNYNSSGNLQTKTAQATDDATGAKGTAAVPVGTARAWAFTYNSLGQMLTATGPRTNVADKTTYVYDPVSGNLLTITNPAGHVTMLSDYDANGRVGKIVDANNVTTDLRYGARGWLDSSVVSTTAGGGTMSTTYLYEPWGGLNLVTLPDSSTLNYKYDRAHRLTDIVDGLGNTIHYGLDALGNRTTEQVKDTTGVLALQVTRVYDAMNRLQNVTGATE